MTDATPPTVMVLGRHHVYALQIAAELSQDLDATVLGVGESKTDPIVQSRYCDQGVVVPPAEDDEERHAASVVRAIERFAPDVVLPVGHLTVDLLDSVRDDVPEDVAFRLPPSSSLDVAFDKGETAAVGDEIGIRTPEEYGRLPTGPDADPDLDASELSYPVFLKAEKEAGKNIVSKVDSESELWDAYEELRTREEGGDIIVQEYIEGDGHTYATGLLFDDGSAELAFGHEEVRSIPREGGTGTRVRLLQDDELVEQSTALLEELDWNGVALVEYKRSRNGDWVLMEINPKFWASYPLASKSGYRFASTLVASSLGRSTERFSDRQAERGEMVFPLREVYFSLKHDEESLVRSLASVAWPPTRVDVDPTDLQAWVAPGGLRTSAGWALDLWRGTDDPF
jgi:predicted ATP-grasp superfamily ATP-dependent carboligase